MSSKNQKIITEKTSQETTEQPTGRKRGGYGGDQSNRESRELEYQRELEEIKRKLPEELREYAEVFCQRK
jgi:hypothetical protein